MGSHKKNFASSLNITQRDRVEFAHEALLSSIDNMAEEAKTTRMTARQVAVLSRKDEYDSAVRALKAQTLHKLNGATGGRPRGTNEERASASSQLIREVIGAIP